MSSPTLYVWLALFLLLIYLLLRAQTRRRSARGLRPLPGPKGYPFIGSVLDLPEYNHSLKFHEWSLKYGPIYQVNLAGQNHVWICKDAIAKDLLSKKSSIYSDRPHIPALEQDNRTSGQYLPLMSQNEMWQRQRKFAKQIMDTSGKASFYGYPELESIRLLQELIDSPKDYKNALESFVARVTCRLAWGTDTPSDELKQRARELLIGVSPTGALGNKLPFVMSMPESLSPAKSWERRRARTEKRFFEIMRDKVADSIETGTCTPSWMRQFLERRERWGFSSDLEGAFAVGMHGIAGALTIAAPMQSFCLAVCHHPELQFMLHEEIDRVCGDAMPSSNQMADMPVLRAFIRETLRWRPPVPTGIPHELVQDDVYESYSIPKGSVMHPLEWSISRDPAVYPEADSFNPMRWLDPAYPTYQEPLSKYPTITGYSQFGYGKRTCQGTAVTEADLFVGIGMVAWLFTLSLPSPATEHVVLERRDSGVDLGLSGTPPTPPDEEHIKAQLDSYPASVLYDDDESPALPALPGTFVDGEYCHSAVDSESKADPTLNYTTLLIAKPLPFDFELKVRDTARAEQVTRRFSELEKQGVWGKGECYWTGDDGQRRNEGNEELGWGKVAYS
ncbi:cytochrome P450 [Myriangium duriaei CBS 260.36]|uniref:Cytochrome P450 n=1 Tax=Myriangium duriaei CBS 260.36 TaxID=1168546 RepID=A0A9P4MHG3_9PEZI|nr:cytochrome P450 [Myriangium duriaei CBS 260.36]